MSEVAPPLDSHRQSQFASAEIQFGASELGMWLFLATEILLFGGLIVSYALLHFLHPEAFFAAHAHLNRTLGFTNTIALLISSYAVVMGNEKIKLNRPGEGVRYLLGALLCAGLFLAIKSYEYTEKFREGLLPGQFYSHAGDHVPGQFLFYSFYFLMTGLHAIHILAGMSLITWMILRTKRGDFSSSYYTPVELTGLYWHLVDMIWIYLFPLLYLIG